MMAVDIQHEISDNDLQPTFLNNTKGSRIMVINGNRYRRNGAGVSSKVRWRCTSHAKYGCKAVVHTINDEIVYFWDYHTTSYEILPNLTRSFLM
ncbi:hypothetical protein HF086_014294 [Spodoptera exigua]|uniref:FLYWCH-type domain-containing protein n=1 Tax=Spodoptera exigua TaxID=7107 RepID=A0A922M7M2_SPOEX|nr:hypothetical protein HF086_014294 [Spodoptera exigua]